MIRCLQTTIIAVSVSNAGIAQSGGAKSVPSWEASLDAVDSSTGGISVTSCKGNHICHRQTYSLTTTDTGVMADLTHFNVGDYLVGLRTDEGGQFISVNGLAYWWFPGTIRVLTLIGFALLFLGFAVLATHFLPQSFIIGEDNPYSDSKFQDVLWFWLLLTTYLSAIFVRVLGPGCSFFGSVNIPEHLLVLSGLSALTNGGVIAITTAKLNAGIAAGNADPKPPAAKPNFFADLVQSDSTQARETVDAVEAAIAPPGAAVVTVPTVRQVLDTSKRSFDLSDFQMLFVTLVAGVNVFNDRLSLPGSDSVRCKHHSA